MAPSPQYNSLCLTDKDVRSIKELMLKFKVAIEQGKRGTIKAYSKKGKVVSEMNGHRVIPEKNATNPGSSPLNCSLSEMNAKRKPVWALEEKNGF